MTKIFISYSHNDEFYRQELEKHLSVLKRNGIVDTWTDRKIIAGENWEGKISTELINAKIILLLISPDFLASNYCYDIELKTAIERHNAGEAIVVPIILRHCDWSNTPFASIQGLPENAQPVKDWNDQDKAFLNVVEGIKALLKLNQDLKNHKEIRLSQIRKKILIAGTHRDLRESKYDIFEYKKMFSNSFEVEELEKMIERGIEYYERQEQMKKCQPMSKTEAPMMYPRMKSSKSCLWRAIIIALLIATLTYFIVKLFIK
jgi:hypothetical protein